MRSLQLSLFVGTHKVVSNKEFKLDLILHSSFIYDEM